MSRIKGKDTAPEILLRKLLHREGFRFRLHVPDLPGKPDIVLKKHKTVIFVHGCFWHRHEGCAGATVPKTRTDFWMRKFEGTVKRDQLKQRQLEEMGWLVLIVWECDLKRAPETVVKDIKNQFLR